jgi:hypothetical protein
MLKIYNFGSWVRFSYGITNVEHLGFASYMGNINFKNF